MVANTKLVGVAGLALLVSVLFAAGGYASSAPSAPIAVTVPEPEVASMPAPAPSEQATRDAYVDRAARADAARAARRTALVRARDQRDLELRAVTLRAATLGAETDAPAQPTYVSQCDCARLRVR